MLWDYLPVGYWISQNDPRCHLTWPTPASGGYVPVPDPVQFQLIPRRHRAPAGAGRPSCGSTAPAWANRRHAASITLRNLVFNHVQALRFRLPDGICGAAGTYGRVENANQAAFTIPRDSPFHNVSIPVGDATLTRSIPTTYEQRVPRQLCAVWVDRTAMAATNTRFRAPTPTPGAVTHLRRGRCPCASFGSR